MHTSILLLQVDDTIRRSLRDWLQRAIPGWSVTGAGSLEEAIAAAEAQWPSMIVADIAHPEMDGVETVRHLKNAAPWASVVALVMQDEDDYSDCLASAGASACLLIWDIRAQLVPTLKGLVTGESQSQHTKAGAGCYA